jgi:hypothetical protein
MSIQTIIDNATFITFNTQRLAAQSFSRSGRLLTAERTSAVPYKLDIGIHDGLTYSTNRAILQTLDNLDITEEENVDIGSTNTGLSYLTAYQGDISAAQILNLTVTSASASNIVLNTTSATGSGTAFKKGDFIQLDNNYRYPYQVTADVAWNASSITVPIHRPFIPQDSYTVAGKGILVGNDVTWNVKMLNKPNYTVMPYDRIQFSDRFELIENIRKEDA